MSLVPLEGAYERGGILLLDVVRLLSPEALRQLLRELAKGHLQTHVQEEEAGHQQGDAHLRHQGGVAMRARTHVNQS